MSDLRGWLETQGLEEYADTFASNRIDLDVLADLTEADLEKLSIPLGDRKRLLKAIALRRDVEPIAGEASAAEPQEQGEAPHPATSDRVERRQMTMMFVDLVGSTALSERLDLEEYRKVVQDHHQRCADILSEYNGFIAQVRGDGILAYFGYPHAGEDDAERAATAGLAITRAISSIESEPGVPLQARVGVATGLVAVGDLVGTGIAERWAATGETPNLAARLQEIADPGTVVACGVTRRLLGNHLICEDFGPRSLKGFSDPVEAWRVIEVQGAVLRFESRQSGDLAPFIGRAEEIELLHRRWSSAKTGKGQTVLVSGEPGIGKSRLVKLFFDQVAGDFTVRLRYQCLPNQRGSPLHPVIAQLERSIGFAAGDGPDQKLKKLEDWIRGEAHDTTGSVEVYAKLLSLPSGARCGPLDQEPKAFREAIFRLIFDQLAGLVEQGPAILVFEDLQWIDPTTQELLDALIDKISAWPIFLICTSRPDFKAHWIGDAAVTYLNIRRLDGRQSAALIKDVSGGIALPAELENEILAKTDGVPLFIEELTKSVLESGLLRRQGRSYVLDPRFEGLNLMPTTLLGSLLARLDRLPGAQAVAPIGAAIGRTFSYALLREVVDLDDETELRAILSRLIEAQLLSQRGFAPESTYKFKHALVQDAAYETMPKDRRRVIHRRIATALSESFSEISANNPEVVADHFARSDTPGQAFDFWRQAATLARQRSANVEAIAHIRNALIANDHIEDADAKVGNEILMREMLIVPLEVASWGSMEIPDNLDKLRKLREARGDTEELLSVLHAISSDHIINGRVSGGRNFARKMLEVKGSKEADLAATLGHRCLGFCEFLSANFDEAISHFERAIELCDLVDLEELKRHYYANTVLVARAMIAWSLMLAGRRAEAEEAIELVLEMSEDERDLHSKTYALCILSSVYQSAGDARATQDFATQALDLSQQHQTRYWEAWAQIMRGWALATNDSPNRGIKELTDGIAKYEGTGSRQMLPYARILLADAYCRTGHVSEGRSIIEDLENSREFREVRYADLLAKEVRDRWSDGAKPGRRGVKQGNGRKD